MQCVSHLRAMKSGIGVTRETILLPSVIDTFNLTYYHEMSTNVHQPRCFPDDQTVVGFQEHGQYVKAKIPFSNGLSRGIWYMVEYLIETVVA